MAKRINMNASASAQGGVNVGLMTSAGNPWTVSDELATELVNRGFATFADAQAAGSQSVVQDLSTGWIAGRSRVLAPGGKVRPPAAVSKQVGAWTRLFGANDFNGGNWSRSAELTGTAL